VTNELWPSYQEPGDLAAIEAGPLADRGLPPTTWTRERGLVEGGAVVAVTQLTDGSDEVRVKETLDRFAITWQMEKS
jgi:hypothetical protein